MLKEAGRELVVLKKTFLPYLIGLAGVSLFVFTFGIERGYPFPSVNSISAGLLRGLTDKLVPSSVEVVALSPFNVFLSLILISVVIGLVVMFPLFFYKLVHYLSPGLYEHERRTLLRVSLPASLLFVFGAVFSYYLVVPQTFALLYMFAGAANVGELFHVTQFVGLVLGLIIAVGLMFQLPIAMVLLTKAGLIGDRFWRKKWRHALVAILIITAFITPDGSGVSMAMLSLPILGLYAVGMKISERRSHETVKKVAQGV